MTKLEFVADHPKNRTDGWSDIQLEGSVLHIHATVAGSGILILNAGQPTAIRAVSGGHASLKPGWDGTLGYSLYALEISTQTPGHIVVEFDCEQAPETPVATTPAQIEQFIHDLQQRTSLFPNAQQEFAQWQEAYRARLAAWLMGGTPPTRVAGAKSEITRQDMSSFEIERFKFVARHGRTGETLLATAPGGDPAPLLVALHGHEAIWGGADIGAFEAGHNDDFCQYFAARGWAVLQPATMDHALHTPGWSLQGEWTYDAMAALDHVIDDPRIDASRVAVCGLSTGAHLAMNMLALDPRVKTGVVGCVFSTWHHVKTRLRIPPHCDCGITAQLADKVEQCDWAALAAPKPVQFQFGRQDACFTPGASPAGLNLEWNTGILPEREFDAAFDEVRRAWATTGRPYGVALHFHDGAHKVDNEAALAWLAANV